MNKRRVLMMSAIGVCLLLLLLGVAALLTSRPDGPPTTDTRSESFKTQTQKIAFLRRYVICPSSVLATEFHIQYLNNSGGMPGPSECEVQMAVKVPPTAISAWTAGCRPVRVEQTPLSWWSDLPLTDACWTRHSTPQYYQRPGANMYLVVYADEGIILKRVSSSKFD